MPRETGSHCDDALRVVDSAALARALPVGEAVEALRAALRAGLDVAATPPRSRVPTSTGQLLLMPAEYGEHAGVKIAGVVPGNPARGLPRISGAYLLMDATTLRPTALLDGEALTLLRTSAVSALAADHLAAPDAGRLVVFGTGPQAFAHAVALHQVRPLSAVQVVGRDPQRVARFAERCEEVGMTASAAAPDAVADADLIACCTSSTAPLFDGRALPAHAAVVAMGSHDPGARELDTRTLTSGTVVVEDAATALREAGDIVIPVQEGALSAASLVPLADVVCGRHPLADGGPRVFKGTGMAWQDLVVAAAAVSGPA
ncbi:ornithine cyclodeaminase family protein [Streptomyces reniochalinae]|uniref:Ornithine cyclodeaminase family protein n=1 Tax=Streptomyces reniochalinae TaxID=2250578 RepID=A0A367EGM3_9ACTN|nr:ornithine cyclodeaminase family protein [Streptomyces reniochalinae]RCG16507.1 ornithine cyclodeaminase family protein [Streptomyces reniochalinae]